MDQASLGLCQLFRVILTLSAGRTLSPGGCEFSSGPLHSFILTADAKFRFPLAGNPLEKDFLDLLQEPMAGCLSQGLAALRRHLPAAEISWSSLSPGADGEVFKAWLLSTDGQAFEPVKAPKKSPNLKRKTVYSSGMTVELSIRGDSPLPFLDSPGPGRIAVSKEASFSSELSARLSLSPLACRPDQPLVRHGDWLHPILSLAGQDEGWKPRVTHYVGDQKGQDSALWSECLGGDISPTLVVANEAPVDTRSEDTSRPRVSTFSPFEGEARVVTRLSFDRPGGGKANLPVPLAGEPRYTAEEWASVLEAEEQRSAPTIEAPWPTRMFRKLSQSSPLGLIFGRGATGEGQPAVDDVPFTMHHLFCSRILMVPEASQAPSTIIFYDHQVALEITQENLAVGGCICLVDTFGLPVDTAARAVRRGAEYDAFLQELSAQLKRLSEIAEG